MDLREKAGGGFLTAWSTLTLRDFEAGFFEGGLSTRAGIRDAVRGASRIPAAFGLQDVAGLSIRKMVTHRVAYQLRGGVHIHLFQNARAIGAHGRRAQMEFAGNPAHCLP
jgi:hypothetical protein